MEYASLSGNFIAVSNQSEEVTLVKYYSPENSLLWETEFSSKIYEIHISDGGEVVLIVTDRLNLLNQNGVLLHTRELRENFYYRLFANGDYFLEQNKQDLNSFYYFTKYGQKIIPVIPESLRLNNQGFLTER